MSVLDVFWNNTCRFGIFHVHTNSIFMTGISEILISPHRVAHRDRDRGGAGLYLHRLSAAQPSNLR